MTLIAARQKFTAPQLGATYNAAEVRTQLNALARSVPPYTTRHVTADTPLTVEDDLLVCDATDAPITVTLPPANQVQFLRVTVKRINAGGNAVTLSGTVDGTVNPSLGAQWASITIQSDGVRWLTLASV